MLNSTSDAFYVISFAASVAMRSSRSTNDSRMCLHNIRINEVDLHTYMCTRSETPCQKANLEAKAADLVLICNFQDDVDLMWTPLCTCRSATEFPPIILLAAGAASS